MVQPIFKIKTLDMCQTFEVFISYANNCSTGTVITRMCLSRKLHTDLVAHQLSKNKNF